MKTRLIKYCAIVALTLWSSTSCWSQGQVTITINATPEANALGYVTGQNYNFTFALNTDPNTGNGSFYPGTASAGANYTWRQEFTIDPQIWTSVSGDGLSGTWVQPSAGDPSINNAVPDSYLITSASSASLMLIAGADGFGAYNVGLTAAGNLVSWIQFSGDFTGLNFANLTDTLPNPNTYLAGYAGPYTTTPGAASGYIVSAGGNAYFIINSLSLDVAPAPEPSTLAMFAGGFGALLRFGRRTGKSRTNQFMQE